LCYTVTINVRLQLHLQLPYHFAQLQLNLNPLNKDMGECPKKTTRAQRCPS